MVGPVSPGLGWGYPLLATTRGTGGSPAPAGSAGAGAGSRRSTSGGGEYPVYSDIRREYDSLEEDEELESFLIRVLDRRDQSDLLDREEQEEQRSTVLRGGRLLRLQCICQLPPASIVTPVEFTGIHFGIYPRENALHVCIVLNIYNNWKL